MQTNSDKAKLIYVPQRGYAEITPNTSEEFQGLYTTGTTSCASVILTNDDYSHFILSHADAGTDLRNISAWVERIIQSNDRQDIKIYVSQSDGDHQYNTIKDIINQSEIKANVILTQNENQVFISRKRGEESITNSQDDFELLPANPENFLQIFARGTEESNSLNSENKLCSNITPAICVFNGEEFCGTKELESAMQSLQENSDHSISSESAQIMHQEQQLYNDDISSNISSSKEDTASMSSVTYSPDSSTHSISENSANLLATERQTYDEPPPSKSDDTPSHYRDDESSISTRTYHNLTPSSSVKSDMAVKNKLNELGNNLIIAGANISSSDSEEQQNNPTQLQGKTLPASMSKS